MVEKGEQLEELLQRLKNILMELRDSETGAPVIREVRFSRELGYDKHTNLVCDLIALPEPGYQISNVLRPEVLTSSGP